MFPMWDEYHRHVYKRDYLASCWLTVSHPVNVYHIDHLNLVLSIEITSPSWSPQVGPFAADGPMGVGMKRV